MEEVTEMVIFNTNETLSETSQEKCDWGHPSRSRRFIALYAEYGKKLGSYEVKNRKQMWIIIAEKLSSEFNMNITPSNAENRWRVLERNYRRYLEKKSAGRKMYFEYANEMDKIFGHILPKKKTSFNSKLLLGSEEVRTPKVQRSVDSYGEDHTYVVDITPPSMKETGKYKKKQKMSIIEKTRLDTFEYQKEKLKLLAKLGNDRNNLIKERNEILKERNEILKNFKCSSIAENV